MLQPQPGVDATGLDALAGAMRAFIMLLRGPGYAARAVYVLLGEALGGRPELLPHLNDYQRELRSAVRAWVVDGIEAGQIRSDLDPDAIAVMAIGVLRGIGLQHLSDPGSVDLAATAQAVDAMFRDSLGAVR